MSGAFPTSNTTGYPMSGRRSYVTIQAFDNYFFSYTVTRGDPPSFTVTGTLGAVTGATSLTCPAGRILRENGKKLYPSANPGITTFMVGVYDSITGLSGFIDPNDRVFAIYNSDKAYFLDNGVSPVDSADDKGQGVYTRGDIVTVQGDIIATAGSIVAGGQIRSSTLTTLTSITANGAASAQTIDHTLGQVFKITTSPPSGVASITLNTSATQQVGASFTLIIIATTVQNTTFTFGSNIVSAGTLVTTAGVGPVTQYYSISFVSDGSTFFETSRTAAQL